MTEAGSAAAKQHWQKITPEARAASLAPLDAGRAVSSERYKRERREWDAIKLRADGASLKEIAEKFGFGDSRKRVRTAVRSVDLPEGKCYLLDRGRPFKRETGVDFYKSFGLSPVEFARLISTSDHPVRAKRVGVIWFAKGTKNLDPVEARACRDLRAKIAGNLLAQDSREEYAPDRFSRQRMLVTLYPHIRDEYQLLRSALPKLRDFFDLNRDVGEEEVAAFALETAQREKKEQSESRIFRELVRWLAEGCTTNSNSLMPAIIDKKAIIVGDSVNNRVAVEVLAKTLGVPSDVDISEIVRHAIAKDTEPIAPDQMRVLLRVHMQELFLPVQAITPAKLATSEKKRSAASPRTLDKGKFCDRIIGELRQIKTLCMDGGRTIVEIQLGSPDLAAWKLRETLPQEDKEVFNSPRQWGPTVGYALRILGKHFGKSPDTVRDWVKASRAGNRQADAL